MITLPRPRYRDHSASPRGSTTINMYNQLFAGSQATLKATHWGQYIIACSRNCALFIAHIPFVVHRACDAAPTESLQRMYCNHNLNACSETENFIPMIALWKPRFNDGYALQIKVSIVCLSCMLVGLFKSSCMTLQQWFSTFFGRYGPSKIPCWGHPSHIRRSRFSIRSKF